MPITVVMGLRSSRWSAGRSGRDAARSSCGRVRGGDDGDHPAAPDRAPALLPAGRSLPRRLLRARREAAAAAGGGLRSSFAALGLAGLGHSTFLSYTGDRFPERYGAWPSPPRTALLSARPGDANRVEERIPVGLASLQPRPSFLPVSTNGRPGRPVRVLRVIARLNVGGIALHVSYLASGLREQARHDDPGRGMSAATRPRWPSWPSVRGSSGAAALALARAVARARPRRRGPSRPTDPPGETGRPPHAHGEGGRGGAISPRFAGTRRPRVVVHTFHGHVLRGYFGSAGSLVFRVIGDALARVTDRLIAVSPEVRDELVRLGVAPKRKFVVVRLGIELAPRVRCEQPAAIRARIGVAPDRFVVGWFGRMTAVKRTDDLLDALAAARAWRRRAAPARRRRRRPRAAGAPRTVAASLSVLFLGYQEDVARWYAACDAIVLSSANEGTPVTLIGAPAAGRPVVATGRRGRGRGRGRRDSVPCPATPTLSPSAWRCLPPTPSGDARWARRAAQVPSGTRSRGSSTTSTGSTATCSRPTRPRRGGSARTQSPGRPPARRSDRARPSRPADTPAIVTDRLGDEPRACRVSTIPHSASRTIRTVSDSASAATSTGLPAARIQYILLGTTNPARPCANPT